MWKGSFLFIVYFSVFCFIIFFIRIVLIHLNSRVCIMQSVWWFRILKKKTGQIRKCLIRLRIVSNLMRRNNIPICFRYLMDIFKIKWGKIQATDVHHNLRICLHHKCYFLLASVTEEIHLNQQVDWNETEPMLKIWN